MKITKADIGKTFRTKGGWTATVAWVYPSGDTPVLAIHQKDGSEFLYKQYVNGVASLKVGDYDLLPPVETKRVRVVLADQREFLPETAMCDVDLLDGKIVAVRLVEHG